MGMVIWLVVVDPATPHPLVLNPSAGLLVYICNRQPVWSPGHVRVKLWAV